MLYESSIAGTPHSKPDFSVLTVGEIISLVSEPENKFDPNAIRVQTALGMKLGYIRKAETGLVRELKLTTLRITQLCPERKWSEIAVEGGEA